MQVSFEFWPDGGATSEVWQGPKLLQFILNGRQMDIPNFIAICPILVEIFYLKTIIVDHIEDHKCQYDATAGNHERLCRLVPINQVDMIMAVMEKSLKSAGVLELWIDSAYLISCQSIEELMRHFGFDGKWWTHWQRQRSPELCCQRNLKLEVVLN